MSVKGCASDCGREEETATHTPAPNNFPRHQEKNVTSVVYCPLAAHPVPCCPGSFFSRKAPVAVATSRCSLLASLNTRRHAILHPFPPARAVSHIYTHPPSLFLSLPLAFVLACVYFMLTLAVCSCFPVRNFQAFCCDKEALTFREERGKKSKWQKWVSKSPTIFARLTRQI